MSVPNILLVEDNIKHAKLLAEVIEQRMLGRVTHVPTGDAAVAWVGNHPCDVCLLDYTLPGINGLETLARIHQRKPDLPVVMMSDDKAVQVAVSAFHGGVHDYVLKQPGFQDAIAECVHHLVREQVPQPAAPAATTYADVPEALRRATYQNRLRVIGRQLDLYGYRAINLLEVGGGFLVRAMGPQGRTPEALEFGDREFPLLVAGAFAARGERTRARSRAPLVPNGYEDLLRALGYWLDTSQAEAITLTQLEQFIAVGGIGRVDGGTQTGLAPFQRLWRADDIAELLEAAYRRRASKPSVFAQLMGR